MSSMSLISGKVNQLINTDQAQPHRAEGCISASLQWLQPAVQLQCKST